MCENVFMQDITGYFIGFYISKGISYFFVTLKVISWSSSIINQLDMGHRLQFTALLTYHFACDVRVIRMLRQRGLRNSASQLQNSLRSWRDAWAGERRQSGHISSRAKPSRNLRAATPRVNSTRLFTNPLTASPLTFTASLPKQKHSRTKSRQLRRLAPKEIELKKFLWYNLWLFFLGELIGVEYLFSQTGRVLHYIAEDTEEALGPLCLEVSFIIIRENKKKNCLALNAVNTQDQPNLSSVGSVASQGIPPYINSTLETGSAKKQIK